MSTEIQPFSFEGHEVRVQVDEAGEPWFCAADVCGVLDLDNVTMAVQCVRPGEKAKKVQPSIELRAGVAPLAPQWFLSESGLYRFLFRSDKPKAEPFQDWLARDVLPSIRETGSYSVAPTPETREQLIARALLESASVIAERDAKIAEQTLALAEAAPKVEFYDRFGDVRGFVGLKQAGKQLHQPELKFVEWIHSSGYLYRDGDGTLVPRAEYGPTGSHLFEVKSHTVNDVMRRQTLLTPKGVRYFASRLPSSYPPVRRRHLPPAVHSAQPWGHP